MAWRGSAERKERTERHEYRVAPNKKNEAPTVRYMTVKSFSTVAWRSQTDTTDSKDTSGDSSDFSCFFLFSSKFAESDSLNWAHSKRKKKVWLFSCYVCVKKFKVDVLTCWPSFLLLTFPYRPILITALGSLPGLSTLPQMCITDNEWQWVCPQARISQWAVRKKPAGKQMWRANKRIRQLKI